MFELKDGYIHKLFGNRKTLGIVESSTNEIVAKRCTSCEEIKFLDGFSNNKQALAGKQPKCRECASEINKEYYENNKDSINDKHRMKYHENPEPKKEQRINHYKNNKEQTTETNKIWYENNKERKRQTNKLGYQRNREHVLETGKIWRLNNPDKVVANARNGYQRNRESVIQRTSQWQKDNPELVKVYSKKWYTNNPDKVRERNRTWYINNKDKAKLKYVIYRTRLASLPNTITPKLYKELLEFQNGECVISGISENLHLEHFIPISWGVGGTTAENCYYMDGSLNSSKHNRNPFQWIQTQSEDYQQRFNDVLVPMMAERNGMTVEEFEASVNEAHEKYIKQSEKVDA